MHHTKFPLQCMHHNMLHSYTTPCVTYTLHYVYTMHLFTCHHMQPSILSYVCWPCDIGWIQIICSPSSNSVTLSTLTNSASHFSNSCSLRTSFSPKLAAATLGTSSLDCFYSVLEAFLRYKRPSVFKGFSSSGNTATSIRVLQYSITVAKILLVAFGIRIPVSSHN
ncbi:hypothetical protein MtrunA17_Chr4g0007821 [Medicago truncatula]|uniref:Uncharacterized protein n=1 Tax=Medicago truncatula TaxID=3880 RepID=A0A396I2I4_MEDTR|nr:hypothetical protein MtrunA17_Chr4g0007821 [Medicago truncatula]